MKTNSILIALLSVMLWSCDEQVANTSDSEEMEATTFEKDKNLEGLTLNQGSKWKVNHETAVGIQNIESIMADFDGEDFKDLGKDVKKELKEIIDLCTMKGEDHDQFHIVLHAMLKESKQLKKGKSESTDKLARYIEVYYAHFEE